MTVDPTTETNSEVPAAPDALAELEAALSRLTAEKQAIEAHMAADVREAGAKVAPRLSMNPDLLVRVGMVAVVLAVFLALSLVVSPRPGQPLTRSLALAIVGGLAILACRYQQGEQKRRKAQMEVRARTKSQAEHGAALAALTAEIAATEARIAGMGEWVDGGLEKPQAAPTDRESLE